MSNNLLIPTCLDKTIEKVADKPAQRIGETISDIWYLIFGGIHLAAEKKELKLARAFEDFRDELDKKISSIPENKLCEPKLQLIGLAMENAKHCVEETELRSMFANLIVASLSTDTTDSVHPSFSRILSELAPFDAQNLAYFRDKPQFPIVQYRMRFENGGFHILQTHVFIVNPQDSMQASYFQKVALSIETLIRLSLISVTYDAFMIDDSLYSDFDKNPFFLANKALDSSPLFSEKIKSKTDTYIQKGIAALTPLGDSLLHVCMPTSTSTK